MTVIHQVLELSEATDPAAHLRWLQTLSPAALVERLADLKASGQRTGQLRKSALKTPKGWVAGVLKGVEWERITV